MCESGGKGLTESRELAVRAELARLLESAAFRTSKRCREFLACIVEHTISGPSGALKERSIGVELFQLPQDFDTGQHAVVRVTANEVRKKLAQHYLAENGLSHPVKIELPPGSYSAEFRWETPAVEAQIPTSETPPADVPVAAPPAAETPQRDIASEHLPPRPSWRTGRIIVYAAAVIVIAGAAFAWKSRAVKPISVDARSPAVSAPAATLGLAVGSVRMIAGSSSSYVDRSGRTWDPDRFFSGGNVLVRPAERILRTLDPNIYRHLRSGDFRYDIPLQPGSYELHLYFAETGLGDFISAESSGEGQRLFRVFANGKQILNAFDVVADADGSNVADERVFRNISPADDGFLHLSFTVDAKHRDAQWHRGAAGQRRESAAGSNSRGLDLFVAGLRRAAMAARTPISWEETRWSALPILLSRATPWRPTWSFTPASDGAIFPTPCPLAKAATE